MQLGTSQLLSQSRQLALTTLAIQSIEVLQFSQQELHDFLTAQAEKNPLIDLKLPQSATANDRPASQLRGASGGTARHGGGGEMRDISETHAAPSSLRDHLRAQAGMTFRSTKDRHICLEIIDSIDGDGYLRRPLWDIADLNGIDENEVARILQVVQGFDPVGVGARNLAECLRLQLAEAGRLDPPMALLLHNLTLLAAHDLKRLAKICKVDVDAIVQMSQKLRKLDPAPGLRFDCGPVLPALPDVLVTELSNGSYGVEVNNELLPRVLLDQDYYAEISGVHDHSTRVYVQRCLRSANWLTRQLAQRADTVLRVASEIVKRQQDFLRNGIESLRPLDLKDVADAIGVHESTVSRAVANKHMMTPRGLFAMKYFFADRLDRGETNGVTTEALRHRLKQLVSKETANTVLSDEDIVDAFAADAIQIARRTVAKYRGILGIPSSATRKRQLSIKS